MELKRFFIKRPKILAKHSSQLGLLRPSRHRLEALRNFWMSLGPSPHLSTNATPAVHRAGRAPHLGDSARRAHAHPSTARPRPSSSLPPTVARPTTTPNKPFPTTQPAPYRRGGPRGWAARRRLRLRPLLRLARRAPALPLARCLRTQPGLPATVRRGALAAKLRAGRLPRGRKMRANPPLRCAGGLSSSALLPLHTSVARRWRARSATRAAPSAPPRCSLGEARSRGGARRLWRRYGGARRRRILLRPGGWGSGACAAGGLGPTSGRAPRARCGCTIDRSGVIVKGPPRVPETNPVSGQPNTLYGWTSNTGKKD